MIYHVTKESTPGLVMQVGDNLIESWKKNGWTVDEEMSGTLLEPSRYSRDGKLGSKAVTSGSKKTAIQSAVEVLNPVANPVTDLGDLITEDNIKLAGIILIPVMLIGLFRGR